LLITISSFEKIGKELSHLAELDILSLFIADEVNIIPEDGKSFWSELLQLKNKFIAKLNRNAKKLVCTATCTFKTYEEIKETTGIMPSRVMRGPSMTK
jgi:hypothetical protein